MYHARNSRMTRNEWITDPTVPEPENFPTPAGWTILVRPYPVKNKTVGGILMPDESIDFANYLTLIGRVISVGPCAWTKVEHYDKQGKQMDWAKPGDFISYAANTGSKRMFKGVSYLMLMDDEILEVLRDPLIFAEGSTGLSLDIPEEDLKKYNTIYNKEFKNDN